jgi:hypothetical protein
MSYLPSERALRTVTHIPIARQQLTTQIERWGLRDAGFSYNIVAVFGSQSTGKSTCSLKARVADIDRSHNTRYFIE